MRGMERKSVDLIYLDPPFNSKHNYAAPIGSKAAGAAFKDTWSLSDIDMAWWGEIAETNRPLYEVLDMTRHVGGKSTMSYLIYMSIRILEMHRILKGTGSLYLHCDPTMSHYLKMVLDAVFGTSNFRNEVIWKRATAKKGSTRKFGSVHDVILYYTKGNDAGFNPVYLEHATDYVTRAYRHEDNRGRFRVDNLTAAGSRMGSSGQPWRDVEIPSGKHWAVPANWPNDITKPLDWSDWTTQDKLDYMDSVGLIYWPVRGTMPGFKRYLATSKGVAMTDMITDVSQLESRDKEKLDYPTQKPLALLERIIKASSNEGDMILDPFCGCATACSAAEKLDRQWVGIDISYKAVDLLKYRLVREAGIDMFTKGAGMLIHRTDIPIRKGKVSKDIKHKLYGLQEGRCNGCQQYFEFRHFHKDHIEPTSKGGPNDDSNLQLLCGHCNILKGAGTMAELKAKLVKLGIGK